MKKALTKTLCILLAAVLFLALLPRLDLASVATAETAPRQETPQAFPQPNPAVNTIFTSEPCGAHLYATLKNGKLTVTGYGDMWTGTKLPWWDCRGEITSVVLPNGLTNISDRSFLLTSMTEITIPGTVKRIERDAFDRSDVEKVELPASVELVERGAFGNYATLEVVIRNPNCLVFDYEVHPVMIHDSHEDLEDEYTYTGESTLGQPEKTIIYGRRSIPVKSVETKDGSNTLYFKDARSFANHYGYKFYPFDVFSDVAEGEYYEIPVAWAVGEEITTGANATEFRPMKECTRAQVVTFLWRAAGEPKPTSTSCPFKDVDKTAYYYKAMLWAVEKGITTGTTGKTFSPDKPCTRAQVVTFLWRAAGQPKPTSTSSPFKDVDKTAFYYKAMLWAVENNITKGTTATTFSPDKTCIRGQVVTFLYRADWVK